MSVYIVAQLRFTDLPVYRRYQAAFPAVFSMFNGELIVADESPQVLEGDWPRDKIVMLRFPTEADALAFQNSPEYDAIAIDRKAGADAVVLMARGIENLPR